MNMACEHCGSTELVPIVYGNVGGMWYQLAVLGKVSLHSIGDGPIGTPLWACRECGEYQMAEEVLLQSNPTLASVERKRKLDELQESYIPVEDDVLARAMGLSSLKSIARSHYRLGVDQLVVEMSSVAIEVHKKLESEWITEIYMTLDIDCFRELSLPELDELVDPINDPCPGEVEPDDQSAAELIVDTYREVFYDMIRYIEFEAKETGAIVDVRIERIPTRLVASLHASSGTDCPKIYLKAI